MIIGIDASTSAGAGSSLLPACPSDERLTRIWVILPSMSKTHKAPSPGTATGVGGQGQWRGQAALAQSGSLTGRDSTGLKVACLGVVAAS
jgi:hypothetical protein